MLLEMQHVSGGYGKKDVCHNISFTANAGEILCVLGPNGCGKSTLFRLILGFLSPSRGSVLLQGTPTRQLSQREMARHIAYIPQNHAPIFNYTVLDVVTMGRASHFSSFSRPAAPDYDAAAAVLGKLGIAEFTHTEYTALSGGQRQLVLIARALCQNARLLVMDEPAANLDFANDQKVLHIIRQLANDGYGIVLSSHSPEIPFMLADRVLLMKEGRVHATGTPAATLTPTALQEVFGLEMDVVTVPDRYGNPHTLCLPACLPGVAAPEQHK